MAQLVKLLDYVSRYENDLTRYPTQFIRLKRHQWDGMKRRWETGAELSAFEQEAEDVAPKERSKFSAIFRLFSSRKEEPEELEEMEEEPDEFGFHPNIVYAPGTIEQLRKSYLDQLFHFQIRWASSTLTEESRVHPKYWRDSLLRSFTQQLPDSFLLFYHPIVRVKKAPMQLDIIMMTPVECICMTVLEEEELAAFVGSGERFWTKRTGEQESKLLNPLLAMNRMESVVARLFNSKAIDFPIRKCLISRNGYIDYPNVAFDVEIVDRRSYGKWFETLCQVSVPMKFAQFQAAQALLDVGQTTAMSRLMKVEEDEEA